MTKVAVVLDGAEASRQRFADVNDTYQGCFDALSADGYSKFRFQFFTDEDADLLFDAVTSREWAAIVFASNALRSEEVASAIRRRSRRLSLYLADGGGLVVLHQIAPVLDALLPAALCPVVIDRSARQGAGRAEAAAPDDVLLHYPEHVDWQRLRDLTAEELQASRAADHSSQLPSLYFSAYARGDLPAALAPVLIGRDEEVLVARSQQRGGPRVVLTTLPLDWEGRRAHQHGATTALLANAIRYASLGPPCRMVWRDPTTTTNELIRRWLASDGRTAMRVVPAPTTPVSDIDRWLLSHVDILLAPADQLRERQEVAEFLTQGGTLLSVAADTTMSEIRAVVGRHDERTLAVRLCAELRAVAGWDTPDSAFALRNIVSALSFLWEDEVHRRSPVGIDPRSLPEGLRALVRERLADPRHREDFGSSLALAQVLAWLEPDPVPEAEVHWMAADGHSREFDIVLQTDAVLAQALRRPDPEWLARAAAELRAQRHWSSVAPVVRVLDATAILAQAGLLAAQPETAVDTATVVCDVLDRFPSLPERGWMSVETTADIVRGLVALRALIPQAAPVQARLAAHAATGVAALRQARWRYERDAKGVAWLARLTHALILAEREFPLGLQRLASLEWPEANEPTSTSSERGLLEHLALENQRLRTRSQDLDRQLVATRRQLAESALAGGVGRATATLVPTVILAVAAGLFAAELGWHPLSSLLANIAVLLSLALTLMAGVFTLLQKIHLLAAPARGIWYWFAKQVPPLFKSMGELKDQ